MAVVNLTSPYDQDAAKIARSQKYAEMLQQQAMAPEQTFSYNGIQAPIPKTAGLAKILQGLAGVYMQNKADEDTKALGERTRGEAGDLIGKMVETNLPAIAAQNVSVPATEEERADMLKGIAGGSGASPLAANAAFEAPGGTGFGGTAAIPARAKTTAERYADVLSGLANPYTSGLATTKLAQMATPERPKFQAVNENDTVGTVDPQTGVFTPTNPSQARKPYGGTSEGAQDFNILLQGDPSSPVYRAAYNRQAAPKMSLDQSTGQIVYQQPDMGAFRPPVGSAGSAASGPPDARPAGISFAPIPGATPPTSEGERKAGTLLARLQNSQAQLNAALAESPGSEKPPVGAAVLGSINPMLGNVATPEGRQRVEAAQLDILDAALTLGTGAAYNREQLEGYRKSYFPQIGDEPKTVEDKAVRLQGIIDAAKIAAGRSASSVKAPAASNATPPAAPGINPALAAEIKRRGLTP